VQVLGISLVEADLGNRRRDLRIAQHAGELTACDQARDLLELAQLGYRHRPAFRSEPVKSHGQNAGPTSTNQHRRHARTILSWPPRPSVLGTPKEEGPIPERSHAGIRPLMGGLARIGNDDRPRRQNQ